MEYITKQEQKRQLERILRKHRSQRVPAASFLGGEDYGAKHAANEREIIDAINRLDEDQVSQALERLVNESIEISMTRENKELFKEVTEKYLLIVVNHRYQIFTGDYEKDIIVLEKRWESLLILHRKLIGFANYFVKVDNQSDYDMLLSTLEGGAKKLKKLLEEEFDRKFYTDYNHSAFYLHTVFSQLRLEYDSLELITRLYSILLERHKQKWQD